jgi:hypothetical protein
MRGPIIIVGRLQGVKEWQEFVVMLKISMKKYT